MNSAIIGPRFHSSFPEDGCRRPLGKQFLRCKSQSLIVSRRPAKALPSVTNKTNCLKIPADLLWIGIYVNNLGIGTILAPVVCSILVRPRAD